jgi:tRNA (mo5U34)-methyltransferase
VDSVTTKDEDVAGTIRRLGPWFHNLHLPDGTQTAPNHFLGDFPQYKWEQIAGHLPADMKGWSVLDIGCNAGFYSFQLARRGATVVGIDVNDRYLAQARWAADLFALAGRVTFRRMQVYDLARTDESFDLVLFMGVLYHLRYPMLGLDIVARRVSRLMLFQTLTMPGMEVATPPERLDFPNRHLMAEPGWPKMAFIEDRFAGDPTNWWAPNHACIEAMLRSAGLEVIEHPGPEIYLCRKVPPNVCPLATPDEAEYLAATGLRPGGDAAHGA